MFRNRAFVGSQISDWHGVNKISRPSSPIGTLLNPATSAQQLKLNGYPSGSYYIDWNGSGNIQQIVCNMDLEGGGWMMILNYVHQGGTNPDLSILSTSFPTLNSEYSLGSNESGTSSWGHISNSLANQRNWTEYMFYGKTSAHSRVIHFRGNNSNIVSYIKTGSGSMTPYHRDSATNFNGSLRNNSTLPLNFSTSEGFSNEGNLAMTNFPMYGDSAIGNPRSHWGIRGGGSRWEVDDGVGDSSASTIHRIWVR